MLISAGECGFVIREEAFEADVGQGVLHRVFDDAEGAGGDVGASECTVEQVVGVADRGSEDLCFDAVVVVDGADGADEFHAIFADVVEATDEGADEERASLGDHECLQGLEAEGHVGFGAFVGEGFARLEAFDGARKLDDDIGGDFRAFAAFDEHRFSFGGDDFGGDWAFDDLADVGEAFAVVHAFFGDEGWVSGDAVEDTKVCGGFDVIEVGTIEVDEHGRRIGG